MVAATAAKAPISFDRNPPKLIGGDELIEEPLKNHPALA
jgi:hypothetical protein